MGQMMRKLRSKFAKVLLWIGGRLTRLARRAAPQHTETPWNAEQSQRDWDAYLDGLESRSPEERPESYPQVYNCRQGYNCPPEGLAG